MFRRVELAAMSRYQELGELDGEHGWTADRWREAIEEYFDEYDRLGIGASARGPQLLQIEQGTTVWTVRQVFEDPEGDHDWGIDATVDLEESDEIGGAAITIVAVGPH